jgi:hypothetical protein
MSSMESVSSTPEGTSRGVCTESQESMPSSSGELLRRTR